MTERLAYEPRIPEGLRALGGVHAAVMKSSLPKELVDLVFLRASLINGCAYCIDAHTRDLREGGMRREKVTLLPVWREVGPLFDERERAALGWTEAVTLVSDGHVPDAEYEAISVVFESTEIAELTLAICVINSYNRLAIAFRKTPRGLLR